MTINCTGIRTTKSRNARTRYRIRKGAIRTEAATSTIDASRASPIELPGKPKSKAASENASTENRNVPANQKKTNNQMRGRERG